jgi:hypothetical protein
MLLMQNCLYWIGYRIFLNYAPNSHYSVFPEYDYTVRLCHNVLWRNTLQFVA